jgi:hypothetical protein
MIAAAHGLDSTCCHTLRVRNWYVLFSQTTKRATNDFYSVSHTVHVPIRFYSKTCASNAPCLPTLSHHRLTITKPLSPSSRSHLQYVRLHTVRYLNTIHEYSSKHNFSSIFACVNSMPIHSAFCAADADVWYHGLKTR